MNVKNIVDVCGEKISEDDELTRICKPVHKKVVGMTDRCTGNVLTQSVCDNILTFFMNCEYT